MKNNYELRGDHAVIFLKRRSGKLLEALVDLEDLQRVIDYPGSWSPRQIRKEDRYYAQGSLFVRDKNGRNCRVKGSCQLLSRFILRNPPGLFVDHVIASETLDNRRANLRPATRILNSLNRVNERRGVRQHVDGWRADIGLHGKYYRLGTFGTEVEARAAYAGALTLATELAALDAALVFRTLIPPAPDAHKGGT